MALRSMTSSATPTLDLSALSDFQLGAAHGGFGRAARATRRAKTSSARRKP